MGNKEEKQKKKEMEKAVREYKQWEIQQAQFNADFQMMEDYLEELNRTLKGNSKKEEK
ncbi:MAG: hypothetical protein Q4E53_09785 [Eubacteriales bacterium]|nr:hypothetical protein [Eubacteriales bacterium]